MMQLRLIPGKLPKNKVDHQHGQNCQQRNGPTALPYIMEHKAKPELVADLWLVCQAMCS